VLAFDIFDIYFNIDCFINNKYYKKENYGMMGRSQELS
jgi:hypothetical protein